MVIFREFEDLLSHHRNEWSFAFWVQGIVKARLTPARDVKLLRRRRNESHVSQVNLSVCIPRPPVHCRFASAIQLLISGTWDIALCFGHLPGAQGHKLVAAPTLISSHNPSIRIPLFGTCLHASIGRVILRLCDILRQESEYPASGAESMHPSWRSTTIEMMGVI